MNAIIKAKANRRDRELGIYAITEAEVYAIATLFGHWGTERVRAACSELDVDVLP